MDLVKVYDTIDRHEGGRNFWKQTFYIDGRACARVGMDVSEWFPVNVEIETRLCDVFMVV